MKNHKIGYLKKNAVVLLANFLPVLVFGQVPDDTTKTITLKATTITAYRQEQTVKQLSAVHETYIIGGRKNEVIVVQDLPANLAEKTGRQIFAKIQIGRAHV